MERKKGIILSTMDYQENHKIIYLLTPNGKVNLLAQRSKNIKKNVNDTQNLTKVSFVSKEKNLAKAQSLEAIDYYFEIKNDIKRFAIASYVLELIFRYVNTDIESNRLYLMIESFLEQLKVRNDLKNLLLQFRIKMLFFLGIQPDFRLCVHCGRKDRLVGLSITSYGMECENHQSRDNIGPTATEIIRRLYLDKSFLVMIEEKQVLDYLSELIDQYYEKHFREVLKSIKMLKDLQIY